MTGVLPVALEEATKVVDALLLSGKEYVCVMRLHSPVPEGRVRSVLEEFQGEIYQRPPLRASVSRRLRTRRIYRLDTLEAEEDHILFAVACEAGTYIRKLCHDVGEALGCGAHMRELRRTRSGPFTEEGMVTMHDVAYAFARWRETSEESHIRKIIQPMEKAMELLPKIYIRDSAVDALCHGAHLAAPGVLSLETGIKPRDVVAVLTQKGEAVALAGAVASTQEILEMDHGFVARTRRVLMPKGLYPRMWRGSKG